MKLKDLKPFQTFKIGKKQYIVLDWEPKVLVGVKRILVREGKRDSDNYWLEGGEFHFDTDRDVLPIEASELKTTEDTRNWVSRLQKKSKKNLTNAV